jgi:hypothetical protein
MRKIIYLFTILQDGCFAHRVEVPLAIGASQIFRIGRESLFSQHIHSQHKYKVTVLWTNPEFFVGRYESLSIWFYIAQLFFIILLPSETGINRHTHILITDFTIVHHSLVFHTLQSVCFRVMLLKTRRHAKCDATPPTKVWAGWPLFPQATHDTPPFGSFDRPVIEFLCF